MEQKRKEKNRILLLRQTMGDGQKYLVTKQIFGRLDGEELQVIIQEEEGEDEKTFGRIFSVFQQKAETYEKYNSYMTRHGCACCSLTTILSAYAPDCRSLRPEQTIAEIEKQAFPEEWKKNYSKHIARQMPISLYGISKILEQYQISHRYIGDFEDQKAVEQIKSHLLSGKVVIIETSRMKRKNGRIVKWFDRRFAGSYHTMVLLGIDRNHQNQIIFTDSATRKWAGERQRLKWAELSDLISYMFPQKKTEDTHVYFSRRKNTGGFLLVDV